MRTSGRHSGREPKVARLGAVWILLALGACRLPQVTTANLDALHDEQGRHQYVAAMLTPTRYVLNRMLPFGLEAGDEGLPPGAKNKKFDDPGQACLRRLLILADYDRKGPALDASRVRHSSWISSRDPSQLSRERAFLQLGKEAVRLQLESPERPPDVTVPHSELAAALVDVVDALRPVLTHGARTPEDAQGALASACERVRTMAVDLEGGCRALRTVERLSWGRSGDEPELAPFWEMNRSLQEQLVRRALSPFKADPSEVVRAAAIHANWSAFGEAFLLFLLDDIGRRFSAGERLQFERLDLIQLLELVEDNGLPGSPNLNAAQAAQLRRDQLGILMTLAVQVAEFDAHVRAAAMRALGSVSGAGFKSLRLEDWTAWWSGSRMRRDPGRPAGSGQHLGPGRGKP